MRYSTFQNEYYRVLMRLKKEFKHHKGESLEKYIADEHKSHPREQGELTATVEIVALGLAQNIYLDSKELYEFLCSTDIKEQDAALEALNSYGYLIDGIKALTVVINVPDLDASVAASIVETGLEKSVVMMIFDKEHQIGGEFHSIYENIDSTSIVTKRLYQLVFNLFMYMRCFPDRITKDAPDFIMEPRNLIRKSITIKTHESLIDHTGVTPHFRRGYFKLLKSDYYVHKKGQVIFIKSTFVKGDAMTILDGPKEKLL
jgi:hypothetical protein